MHKLVYMNVCISSFHDLRYSNCLCWLFDALITLYIYCECSEHLACWGRKFAKSEERKFLSCNEYIFFFFSMILVSSLLQVPLPSSYWMESGISLGMGQQWMSSTCWCALLERPCLQDSPSSFTLLSSSAPAQSYSLTLLKITRSL